MNSRTVARRLRLTACTALVALSLAAAPPARAAAPAAPEQLSYQGLLLDSLGDPRTGNVDLTLRVFDAVTGGTLVYVQTFSAVPLADGVFTVELGPVGAASDGAVVPLTTDLGDAFTADLGGGADRFLEVTVGAETPLARTQILSAPFALQASQAATASDAANVGGLSSDFVTALFQYGNSDFGGPVNSDPDEGLGDTDGDGIPNFVDGDNDDDGIPDSLELPGGINLVTPTITGAVPAFGRSGVLQTVTITGTNFEPGLGVQFGAEAPAPSGLTATSFDVQVGAQPRSEVDVTVTRTNGQQATALGLFDFLAFADHTVDVVSAGTAGITVHLGLTGSQQWVVSGSDEYQVDTDGDAQADATFAFPGVGQIAVAFDPAGALVGLRCRFVSPGCDVEVARDSDADFDLADETGVVIQSLAGSGDQLFAPSLAFGPLGEVVAGYLAFTVGFGNAATVAHDRDNNGDFLGANELVVMIFVGGQKNLGDVAVDGLGRAALVTHATVGTDAHFGWDRSGDGDFDDSPGGNPERILIVDEVSPLSCLAAAFAPDGDPVVVYGHGGKQFLRDLNQDGDFADAGEQTTLAGGAGPCHLEAGPGSPVAVAYRDGGDAVLRVDRNDDGDFDDVDETVVLGAISGLTDGLSVAPNASGRPFVATFEDTGSFDAGEILADWTTP